MCDQWIPVSERLPEPLENVLICVPTIREHNKEESFHFEVGWYVPADPADDDGADSFDTESDCYVVEEVTHWRPLPAPPKEHSNV